MLMIPLQLFDQMVAHLQACYPLEGCGLLAGNEAGRVTAVYPIHNILQSPTAYKMNPNQQVEAMLAIEATGQKLLAIYHSHPQGPEWPSPTDISQAFYPEAITVIVSLRQQTAPVARAFQIVEQTVVEQKMKVLKEM